MSRARLREMSLTTPERSFSLPFSPSFPPMKTRQKPAPITLPDVAPVTGSEILFSTFFIIVTLALLFFVV